MYWILLCVVLAILIYFYLFKPFTYWARKGVPQKSVFRQWADILRLMLQINSVAEMNRITYNEFSNKRYCGSYQFLNHVLFLRDPDLIKQITVKDFDHFVDHNQFFPEELEPLFGKSLFSLKGDRWRDMRATLSPSFTGSKMRSMFILMNEAAQQFINHFRSDKMTHTLDMKDAFSRYANDVIASTAFGFTCDSLKEPNNEFYLMGKEATNMRGFWRNLRMLMILTSPKLCMILGIRLLSVKVTEFFRRLVKTNIESREKTGLVRPDMIQLLMEAKTGRMKLDEQQPSELDDAGFAATDEPVARFDERRKPQLTDDDLTAQALVFFFAGFDGISTFMCFVVHELAVNPDIQEKLRDEVDDTLRSCGGSLTYEKLVKMKYMDMVVSETLRKWPVAVGMDRVCVKPYTIQPTTEDEAPIHIQKGDILWLPVYGIHRSPLYYPNPERFDPERFSDENKGSISPYIYLPFGVGPRICIGNRFALLETKTAIFHILTHFEIMVTEKTNIPLKLSKDLNLFSANGFWFQLKPRNV